MDNELVNRLLQAITELNTSVARDEGHRKAEALGLASLELTMRLAALNHVLAEGYRVPNAARWIKTFKQNLRANAAQQQKNFEDEFGELMANHGMTVRGKSELGRMKKKAQRKHRTVEGKCVECPPGDVNPTLPGKRRCARCSAAHSARNKLYREKVKARRVREGGAQKDVEDTAQDGDKSGTDAERGKPADAETKQTERTHGGQGHGANAYAGIRREPPETTAQSTMAETGMETPVADSAATHDDNESAQPASSLPFLKRGGPLGP